MFRWDLDSQLLSFTLILCSLELATQEPKAKVF